LVNKIRDYQELGIRLIGQEIINGNKAVCFVMGTGLGKTFTLAELCRRYLAKDAARKILWTVHREELVSQAFDELSEVGLQCGVIMASPTRIVNPFRPVQVASIQTLLARKILPDGITLFITDECHHAPSATWAALPNTYKARGAIVLGATATPCRGDGIGLGEVYDALVQPISIKDAIDREFLVPCEIIRPPFPLKNDEIAQSPIDAYLENANGQKAIVFAAHIIAGTEFLEGFKTAGIAAEMVTGKMDSTERRAKMEAFRTGKIKVLVNVAILTEGFNDPATSCIILARPVGSVGLYLQIIGRGLRLHAGKTKLTVIDLHGSSHVHGGIDEERDWQLQGEALRKAKTVNPERFCQGCGILLTAGELLCPLCETARPEMLPPSVMNIKLVKFAHKRKEDISKRVETLARWIQTANPNHKFGALCHRYKAVYSEMPTQEIISGARLLVATKRAKLI
jgi:DNA repair protein RadD